MATLFNTKISATYEGLLKTIDNAAITATLRELTDGSGNQSGLYLNTAGDFKVTAILEWGSLKDTGTGVTITQFVTAANGIENFDNDTTIPTSAAVKIYVDSKPGESLTQVLGFGNTTSGKDILVSAGDDITFTDTSKILMGASGDLEIYHDGSNSYIKDVGTGTLNLQGSTQVLISGANGEVGVQYVENAGVNLRHNNVQKLITTSSGAEVTGDLVVTGTITASGGSFLPLAGGTMTGNIVLNDNVRLQAGTSNDLQIYHNGTDSLILDSGTGNLRILGSTSVRIQNQGDNADMIVANSGNGVNLYYNNSKKFETTNTGATITGALTTTSNVEVGANATFVDNGKAVFGAGSDLQVYHDGSNSYVRDVGTGRLWIDSNGQGVSIISDGDGATPMAHFYKDAAVELYYNNILRLETVTAGAKVTGDLEVTGTITGAGGSFLPLIGGTMTGDTIHNDNVKSIYGTASDGLEIYHDSNDSFITDTGTGGLIIKGSRIQLQKTNGVGFIDCIGNAVELKNNGTTILTTLATGISVTGNVVPTGNVHVQDAGQLQLGTGINGKIYHDGNNFIVNNLTGDLYIDQAAVTQSIVFRTSDANALDRTALTINRGGDLITGRDVTIAGDLTVNGTTTTVNTETLSVQDPLIELAKDNAANSLDIGFYGKYNDGTPRYLGLFNDASDSNKFKLFKGTTVEPTTTVNIGAAGYVAADLELANLEATGNVTLNSRLTFDYGGGHYLEAGTNTISYKSSTGSSIMSLNASTSAATFAGGITIPNYIYHAGDTNTYFGFNGADDFRIYAGNTLKMIANADNVRLYYNGAQKFETTSTGISVTGSATFTGNVDASLGVRMQSGQSIDFIDTNLGYNSIKRDSTNGGLQFNTGGTASFNLLDNSDALFAGNVFLPDNKYATFGGANNAWELQIGVVGDNAFIEKTSTTNGDLYIKNNGSSKGIIFQNGGSTALTIDSSQNATFAGNVTLTGAGDKILDIYRDGGSGHSIRLHSEGASWIDNNNNFGIGTTSPSSKLTVNETSVSTPALNIVTARYGISLQGTGTSNSQYLLNLQSNGGSTEVMRVQSSGNVGIGTTSPSAKLEVEGDIHPASNVSYSLGSSAKSFLFTNTYAVSSAGDLQLLAGSSEKMRITSAGDVLIGTTEAPNGTSAYGSAFTTGSVNRMVLKQASSYTGTSTLQAYYNPNGQVGSIKTNGSATSYNTSSDYRLKEDLKDFNGLEMVSKIPVYDYKWKVDDSRSYGVMAHELKEVLPQAVSGEKDAEEMQSVDYSKIVPLLIKSIQELKAEIEILKEK